MELRSHFGHDKSIEIRKYVALPEDERPTMFYAGDGVSDLSAAKETDILFAKQGRGERIPMFHAVEFATNGLTRT